MLKNHWLVEQLKTIKNLCDISLMCIDSGKTDLLVTVLEVLQIEVQQVVEENCTIDLPDNKNMEGDWI